MRTVVLPRGLVEERVQILGSQRQWVRSHSVLDTALSCNFHSASRDCALILHSGGGPQLCWHILECDLVIASTVAVKGRVLSTSFSNSEHSES